MTKKTPEAPTETVTMRDGAPFLEIDDSASPISEGDALMRLMAHLPEGTELLVQRGPTPHQTAIVECRRGRISVLEDVLASSPPELLAAIFSRMIVWKADPTLRLDSVEYFASSPDFRPLHPGEVIPEYRVEITKHMPEITREALEGEVTPSFTVKFIEEGK